MSTVSLVCPFDDDLISSFNDQRLVVDISDPDLLPRVGERVRGSDNRLESIRIWWDRPMSEIMPRDEWREIPFILYAPRFGEFRPFIDKKTDLGKLDARFYLNGDDPQTPVSLKIVSSLGLACGIYFGVKPPDWEILDDLMHYAYYSRAPHAMIEPFNYMAESYDATRHTTMGAVYCDDPAKYLHMDRQGNIALTARELRDGVFAGKGVDSVPALLQSAEYGRRLVSWQEHMLARDACSCCPSFRVCAGRFAAFVEQAPGCRQFFEDLLGGVEYIRETRKKK